MRRFHSYGPVNCRRHFCVERQALIATCLDYIIGDPDEGGNYFTIWAPRQTGKTWLMRQVKNEIKKRYSNQFIIADMSMQGVVDLEEKPVNEFLKWVPYLVRDTFNIEIDETKDWMAWHDLFHKNNEHFDRPIILFIDEFDKLPPKVIDHLITLFRSMYLKRDVYRLHGLALLGVRSVLGVESQRGSPFNVQRSLQVHNFTQEEVFDLYHQYVDESGQDIETEVIEKIYDVTRGQPGLVCWLGELLTESYNANKKAIIDHRTWDRVYLNAMTTESNNTILNLIKKATSHYTAQVLHLFAKSDIPFIIVQDWCNYLYLNGIIESERGFDETGNEIKYTRFSCPFIQERLYNVLTYDLIGDRPPILALDFLDTLDDVFEGEEINLPALLQRYKDYLLRLKAKGLNPWQDQPRRTDLHITEWVGHFHLYSWLQAALGRRCVISPEFNVASSVTSFPTGNGRVDIHIRCQEKLGIIEVKSFSDAAQVKKDRKQAAQYAKQLNMNTVVIALFIPTEDEKILKAFSTETEIEDIKIVVVPIGLAESI